MQKIILYYKFVPIGEPDIVMLWQKALCRRLNLHGRIIISKHGINGTLGGLVDDLKSYIKESQTYAPFLHTEYKWGQGGRTDFPKLSVKVRDEIVTFGAANELIVNDQGVVGGGKHLKPVDVHTMVKERGEDVIFFDGRNAYEATVGKFKGAIVPDTRTTKDFLADLEGDKYESIKDKPVITYCTGGIRCEVLSSLMINRGFKEVYQMDGGIVNYGKTYGDDGLWEGSLYVFDGRMGVKFSDSARDIAVCIHCDARTSRYTNCSNKQCNDLIIICQDCLKSSLCVSCMSPSDLLAKPI